MSDNPMESSVPAAAPMAVHVPVSAQPPPVPRQPHAFPPPPPPPPPRKSTSGPLKGCLVGCGVMALLAYFALDMLGRFAIAGGIDASSLPSFGSQVAVVRLEGAIDDSRAIIKQLKSARENSRVKAVVVRIDSPGGAVGASEEIAREVDRIRTQGKKPVVASMGNAAASGGYYVACATDTIYANAGTITASIGVVAPGLNFTGTLEKLGIAPQTIKSGEHKDSGNPYREMTGTERKYLQGVIFDAYRQFFRAVLKSRSKAIDKALASDPDGFDRVVDSAGTKAAGKALEDLAFEPGEIAGKLGVTSASEAGLRRVADGRVLTGEQALATGLVDKIGGLEDAIADAAKRGGITGKPSVTDKPAVSPYPTLFGRAAREAFDAFGGADGRLEYR